MKYTIVVEWPDGEEPVVRATDQFLGGKVCAVQFSDALAELEAMIEAQDRMLNAQMTLDTRQDL